MKRKFRLRKNSELKRVRREGKSYAHPLIVLQVLPNFDMQLRIGIVATKTVGNAVKRNYAKRLIREAVRNYLDKIQPGWNLVFIARSPILEARFESIRFAIEELLNKSKLLVISDVK